MSISDHSIPDHVPPELVYGPEYRNDHMTAADPFVGIQAVRNRPDIFYCTEGRIGTNSGGGWVATSAGIITEILRDAQSFSSYAVAGFSRLLGEDWPLIPVEIDPPLQTEFRKVMAPILAPRRVQQLEDEIRLLARELIDKVVDAGECEFVSAFGTPLPVLFFMRLMGMQTDRLDTFLDWEYNLLHSPDIEKRMEAAESIREFLLELISARRAEPAEDLVGLAVNMQVQGRALSEDEVLGMCYLLFVAGLDTVAASLGYMFRHLALNPADRTRLAGDHDLIPDAIEELLRRHSVVTTRRLITRDMEFHGVHLKKGEYIECDTGLANTDPRAFKDPLEVDIARKPNPHLAFGGGPHRCFGSNLARAEMRIALEEWLERIPEFSIKPHSDLISHGGVRGLDALTLVW